MVWLADTSTCLSSSTLKCHTWWTSRSRMSTLCTRPSCRRTLAVMAMSLMMQKPEPASGKAWCVPPAVLQASLYCRASLAVSSVPATHREYI